MNSNSTEYWVFSLTLNIRLVLSRVSVITMDRHGQHDFEIEDERFQQNANGGQRFWFTKEKALDYIIYFIYLPLALLRAEKISKAKRRLQALEMIGYNITFDGNVEKVLHLYLITYTYSYSYSSYTYSYTYTTYTSLLLRRSLLI